MHNKNAFFGNYTCPGIIYMDKEGLSAIADHLPHLTSQFNKLLGCEVSTRLEINQAALLEKSNFLIVRIHQSRFENKTFESEFHTETKPEQNGKTCSKESTSRLSDNVCISLQLHRMGKQIEN